MHSQTHFVPGGRSQASRIIQYLAWNPDATSCSCAIAPLYKPGADNVAYKATQAQRISQLVQCAKGGRTQYGNLYLGQPISVNALGRTQGMPGGSGRPPLNKF